MRAEPGAWFAGMIPRRALIDVQRALARQAATALLGPRQVGKTTLVIDEGRRAGRRTGRFLILGSASVELLKQAGETLAGRIEFVQTRLPAETLGRLAAAPPGTRASFYRTAAGAEIDLVLELPGRLRPWAVEVSRGLAPRLARGFHSARADLQPERTFVVCAWHERYPWRSRPR